MKPQTFSKIQIACLAVAILLGTGTIFAQPNPPDFDKRGPDDSPRWDRERVETIIIGKFSSELELTPDQAEKFFPRFHQFQSEAEDLQRQKRDQRSEMDELSRNPQADQARVNALISEQGQRDQRLSDLKQKFLSDVSGFLSPQQVSRCSILLDDLPRRIHKFIEDRQEGRGPGSLEEHPRRGPHSR